MLSIKPLYKGPDGPFVNIRRLSSYNTRQERRGSPSIEVTLTLYPLCRALPQCSFGLFFARGPWAVFTRAVFIGLKVVDSSLESGALYEPHLLMW